MEENIPVVELNGSQLETVTSVTTNLAKRRRENTVAKEKLDGKRIKKGEYELWSAFNSRIKGTRRVNYKLDFSESLRNADSQTLKSCEQTLLWRYAEQ